MRLNVYGPLDKNMSFHLADGEMAKVFPQRDGSFYLQFGGLGLPSLSVHGLTAWKAEQLQQQLAAALQDHAVAREAVQSER